LVGTGITCGSRRTLEAEARGAGNETKTFAASFCAQIRVASGSDQAGVRYTATTTVRSRPLSDQTPIWLLAQLDMMAM
jgi:hypothetical protein